MYENENYTGGGAGSYNTGQFSGGVTGSEVPKTITKEKKKTGTFKKVVLSITLGLLFGAFAGVGFYAVQHVNRLLYPQSTVSEDANAFGTVFDGSLEDVEQESESGISMATPQEIAYTASDISEVVEEVMPAMVSIINNYTETGSFFGRHYEEEYASSGSGIIVAENDSEILIVSNNHVVEDADSLEITFIDGTTAPARIKGTDSGMDLAVLAVKVEDLSQKTKEAIAIATLGDSDTLKLGEPVIAIGNALGYGQSVTDGIISALDREVEFEDGSISTFIQTNAAINFGNSGGALLNIRGEVIGINSSKLGGDSIEGMGYAIPITSASPIIAELMERQIRDRVAEEDMGYIGIELQEVNSQASQMYSMPQGVFVVTALEDGAAWKAGIIKGDIIVEFDGIEISSYVDLQDALSYYAVGDEVQVTVMRQERGEYKAHEFTLVLGEKPTQKQ